MNVENTAMNYHDVEDNGNVENTGNVSNVKVKRMRIKTKEKVKTNVNANVKQKVKANVKAKEDFKIPEFHEYENVTTKLLNSQLKEICRNYKLKVSGKKEELVKRIKDYLYHSSLARILQSKIKRSLSQEWIKLHGLGLFNRSDCVNESDIMGDDLVDIPYQNFFSFTEEGFTYGFDISTFEDIVKKTKKRRTRENIIKGIYDNVENPYTRNVIDKDVIKNYKKMKKYTKILLHNNDANTHANTNVNANVNVNTNVNANVNANVNTNANVNSNILRTQYQMIQDIMNNNNDNNDSLNLNLLEDNEGLIYNIALGTLEIYTQENHNTLRNNNLLYDVNYRILPNNQIEECIVYIFNKIDDLGHYTNPDWLLSLTIPQLRIFIRDMKEIFDFRAGISNSVKRNILPDTNGILEVGTINLNNWLSRQDNIWMLRAKALNYIIKLVTKGITEEERGLGAFYVLTALTLSSPDAANAMPWLYQAAV